jgi:hypothetical protein
MEKDDICDWCGARHATILEDQTPTEKMLEDYETFSEFLWRKNGNRYTH